MIQRSIKNILSSIVSEVNKTNQLNIFNQDIFKQLSKHLTHLEHKVTCYIIN